MKNFFIIFLSLSFLFETSYVSSVCDDVQSSYHFNHDSLIVSSNIYEIVYLIHSKSDVLSQQEYNHILSLLDNIKKYVIKKAEEDYINHMIRYSNDVN